MAERITRPVVRLAGGLPDGSLSSLESLGGRLLSGSPPDVYAIVWLTRSRLIEDDDQDGAETAVLKTRAVESFPLDSTRGAAARFPFDVQAGELVADVLHRMRTDRTGEAALPLATSAEADEEDRAREAIRQWADAHLDEGRDGLAAVWNDYFGDRSPAGTVTSWRDAPAQMVREFLAAKGEEPSELAEVSPAPDGTELDADAARPEDTPPTRALSSVPAAAFAEPTS